MKDNELRDYITPSNGNGLYKKNNSNELLKKENNGKMN